MRFIGRWTPAENNNNIVTCHATGHAHSILPYSLARAYRACAHVVFQCDCVHSSPRQSRLACAAHVALPCPALASSSPTAVASRLSHGPLCSHASSVVITPLASATRPRLTAHSANTIAAIARNVPARSAHATASSSARTLRPLHLPPAAILCVSTLSPATHLLLAAAGARAWGWVLALLCRVLRFVRE